MIIAGGGPFSTDPSVQVLHIGVHSSIYMYTYTEKTLAVQKCSIRLIGGYFYFPFSVSNDAHSLSHGGLYMFRPLLSFIIDRHLFNFFLKEMPLMKGSILKRVSANYRGDHQFSTICFLFLFYVLIGDVFI